MRKTEAIRRKETYGSDRVSSDRDRVERLLLALCSRTGVSRVAREDVAFLSNEAFLEEFVSLVAVHGVQGLVLSALEDDRLLECVTRSTAERLARSLYDLRRAALLWDLERDRLVSQLARRGLDPVVLKGGALRQQVYDEPVQRQMTDIDLLLLPEQMDYSVAALRALGYENPWVEQALESYRQHHFHIRLVHSNEFVVELHWGLVRPRSPIGLDPGAFLRRSSVVTRVGGVDLRVPSLEDTVLHMVSQNFHDVFRLRRLVDVDRALAVPGPFDWDYLERAAAIGGLGGTLALSLRLCEVLLGTAVPEGVIRRLIVDGVTRLHLALLRPAKWPVSLTRDRVVERELRQFWCLVDWRSRARLVAGNVNKRCDPLKWVWEGKGAPEEEAAPVTRDVTWPLKLAGYQVWVYCRAILSLLSARGRHLLNFWSPAGRPKLAAKGSV